MVILNINKFLDEYNISKENIAEYQEYMLYDIVIKTWVDTHGGSYDKAKENMEALTLVDNTYRL